MKSRFAKSLVLIALVFAANAYAQTDCGLANTPTLINLKLGASPAEVKNIFGKSVKFKVKNKGDRTFFQNYIEKPAPEILRGVRAFYLRFLDGRLYQIEVFYEARADWQTLAAFAADFAARSNFDRAVWQTDLKKSVIECADFTLVADKILNPRLQLTDKITFETAMARRVKK